MSRKADEEIGSKYTFFRKYFEIGDEEIKIHKKLKCFFVTSVKKNTISPRNSVFFHAKKKYFLFSPMVHDSSPI